MTRATPTFGPNKTNSCLYWKAFAIFFVLVLFAFSVAVLIYETVPRLMKVREPHEEREARRRVFNPTDPNELDGESNENDLNSFKNTLNNAITNNVFTDLDGKIKLCTMEPTNGANQDKLDGNDIEIETKLGKIKGRRSVQFGMPYQAFLGIPYAKPPIGDLRLKKPESIEPWNGTIDATKPGPNCVQYLNNDLTISVNPITLDMSEDCLQLNIWTPGDLNLSDQSSLNETSLKTVMIWIHGGGFTVGSTLVDETDGRVLALMGDVIVVTFNYRVGALGFFDLGIDEAPGNQGLWDQAAAFHWVKDNIKSFGGNPSKITLFGQSAGAISIGLHMVSPVTRHLFRRAIMQSGSPILFNFYYSRNAETVKQLLHLLGCHGHHSADKRPKVDLPNIYEPEILIDCIKGKSTDEIVAAQQKLLEKSMFPFAPNPYDDFLPMMPTDIIKEGTKEAEFSDIHDVLLGVNQDEASVYLHYILPEAFPNENDLKINLTNLDQLRELVAVNLTSKWNIKETQGRVLSNIFLRGGQEKDTTKNLIKRLYDLIGSLSFVCPVVTLADELSELKDRNVYMYLFSQRSAASTWGDWFGVPHHDEVPFVFGHPLRYPHKYSGQDIETSKRLLKTWTHFAKTGEVLDQLNQKWEKYKTTDKTYMELNGAHASVGHRLNDKVCSLFRIGFDTFNKRKKRQISTWF